MKVYTEDGNLISENVIVADSFFKRLKGWMFKKKFESDEVLLIIPCNSIHTCFMKFDMDALFIDNENRILAKYDSIKPFKMIMPISGSSKVLELSGGVLKKNSNVEIGKKLIFE